MNGYKVVSLCLMLLLLTTAAHAKIVFGSERNGEEGIYMMDDDGSNLTFLLRMHGYPTGWSPDGKHILWTTGIRINMMNADGTNIRQLIKHEGDGSINGGRFSPDGQHIVFKKSDRINKTLKFGIYVLNIKTLKIKQISDFWGIQLDWSPNGKHIICAEPISLGGGVHNTIWIMDADGHNLRPLVPKPPKVGEFTINRSVPRWSPDSKQIVFLQREYKYVGAMPFFKEFRYIICDHNGDNIKQLRIPKDWEGVSVDWMDDGKSIVFSARENMPVNEVLPFGFVVPSSNIYKYHIWTGEITRLTNHPGKDQTLDWISDDVLSVSPREKKKVTWGEIKQ